MDASATFRLVSVVIPARNEVARVADTVLAVRASAPAGVEVEVIVADDGSTDGTADAARAAGAAVVSTTPPGEPGNPAAARNRAAESAGGDPLIFLDADCLPQPGWLSTLLAAHAAGHVAVGGSTGLPPGLPFSARTDFWASAYHVHPRRRAGFVPNHPPCNLSVRRDAFRATCGFWEKHPAADGHEELAWQAELQRNGGRIRFEPGAEVLHFNRPGFRNLFRRSYRWAYSAVESKATWGAARFGFLYRSPILLVLTALPLALLSTGYVLGCWVAAGVLEPLLHLPWILTSRVVYAAGMLTGGFRWLAARGNATHEHRPGWR